MATPATATPVLSIVAPCYNEEESLPEFYRRTTKTCVALNLPYEIVLVNDGSRDRTWELMQALARLDPCLVCVNLSRNHGHQLALSAGLSVCRGERILVIDADLQDPPELLPEMLRVMDDGIDVVYGQRRRRAGESLFKRASAALFYRVLGQLTSVPIPADTGDFRLMSRRVLDILLNMPERHRFIRGMVSWIGFRQEPLHYDRDPRYAGETKYPLRKMWNLGVDAVTAFSVKPLQAAGVLGLLSILGGVGLLLATLITWVAGGEGALWLGLFAFLAVLGGVQLLGLGIVGEYLGRLHENSRQRPLFLIESIRRFVPSASEHVGIDASPASVGEPINNDPIAA
ncbi:MAG: glycosyltransferase family 2 protein [Planctomycetes bacterium]|nr:glycosyltransferase family 2 protein [Planctomycetota bacterium]